MISSIDTAASKRAWGDNWAWNRPAAASSQVSNREAGKAVDGDPDTYWQPSSADRDDRNVWICVHLEEPRTFNTVVLQLNRGDNIRDYAIQYSDDGLNRQDAYVKTEAVSAQENVRFDEITASYVKVNFNLSRNLNVQLYELAVLYDESTTEPAPGNLALIRFTDSSGRPYSDNGEIRIPRGERRTLRVTGLTDSGQSVSLERVRKIYTATSTSSSVDSSGTGDDTQRIQEAIDRLSLMPRDANGFRGAVLLRKGIFRVAGTLRIRESGVVLRGEGSGEEGTIILGTGTKARNLLEAGGNAGPAADMSTAAHVSDLYVPSGARSFHVEDASRFAVGDQVIVRRAGNERWIHEIGMDYIYMRPGQGGTQQWSPFNLDFDRVITAIDGNRITVDAPLANAIERKWGGGQMFTYADEGRIEQVGVENMRVISEFDKSKTDTRMDNEWLDEPYYSDEDHAERFVMMNSVKNAWVRDVRARGTTAIGSMRPVMSRSRACISDSCKSVWGRKRCAISNGSRSEAASLTCRTGPIPMHRDCRIRITAACKERRIVTCSY